MHFQNNTKTFEHKILNISNTDKHEQTSSYSSNRKLLFQETPGMKTLIFPNSNAVCKSSSLCHLLASAGIKLHHFPK